MWDVTTHLRSKYIGLPNLFDKSKKATFEDVIDKVKTKFLAGGLNPSHNLANQF
jgi:hypothetical protein